MDYICIIIISSVEIGLQGAEIAWSISKKMEIYPVNITFSFEGT